MSAKAHRRAMSRGKHSKVTSRSKGAEGKMIYDPTGAGVRGPRKRIPRNIENLPQRDIEKDINVGDTEV
jgi:hypothetical protein